MPLPSRSAVRGFAASGLLGFASAAFAQHPASERIQLRLDTWEAEAVLAAIDTKDAEESARERAWQRILASEPYVRLKKREASMGRSLTDEDFRRFVFSKDLATRAPALRHTLEAWKKEDLVAAARRVLPYLPEEATIRAKVYVLIKPSTNSFVFELETDPAIFLYLDSEKTAAQFANTVAHELHHVGYATVRPAENETKDLTRRERKALAWMGAFGEGFAMLAAVGSPDVHPHATGPAKDRERWDRDVDHFDDDLATLDRFFLDVIDGRLKTNAEVDTRAFTFFGTQGPWYTVGYRMAVLVEKHAGRAELIRCMSDPRRLLAAYNLAAVALNAKGSRPPALWSPELLEKIGARATRGQAKRVIPAL